MRSAVVAAALSVIGGALAPACADVTKPVSIAVLNDKSSVFSDAGGVGSVAGAVMGAFIMSALDNGMSMMDVATFWQYIVKGVILLLAVWMDSATKRRS